jgi:hypothetical protein
MDWFNCAENNNTTFSNVQNTPDITIVDVSNKNVTIVELACCFDFYMDFYMDLCFNTKLLKYQPLVNSITNLGFNCTLIILIFGSPQACFTWATMLWTDQTKCKKTCRVLLHLCHNRQFSNLEKKMQCLSMMKIVV